MGSSGDRKKQWLKQYSREILRKMSRDKEAVEILGKFWVSPSIMTASSNDLVFKRLVLEGEICKLMKNEKTGTVDCHRCYCLEKGWAYDLCGAGLDDGDPTYIDIIYDKE